MSVDPEASARTETGARPDEGVTVSVAEGGESATVTDAVAVDASPAESVTVAVTVNVPAAAYVCVAVGVACGPTADEPSPKSNL